MAAMPKQVQKYAAEGRCQPLEPFPMGYAPINYLHEGSRADMYTNVTPSGSLALSEEAIVHFSQGQHSQRGGHMRDYLTVQDMAYLLLTSPQGIRDVQDRGELHYVTPGSSHRRTSIAEFTRYIAARGYTPEQQAEITRQMRVRLRDVPLRDMR